MIALCFVLFALGYALGDLFARRRARRRDLRTVLDLSAMAASCTPLYAMAKARHAGKLAVGLVALQRQLWNTRDDLADKSQSATNGPEQAH